MPAADTTAAQVGRKIRARMGEERVSMSAMSRSIGINRMTLTNQIDNGGVTVRTLVLIAQALNADPAEFLPSATKASA